MSLRPVPVAYVLLVGRPAHAGSRLHTQAEQGEWGLLPGSGPKHPNSSS